jgi:hypothetical protein
MVGGVGLREPRRRGVPHLPAAATRIFCQGRRRRRGRIRMRRRRRMRRMRRRRMRRRRRRRREDGRRKEGGGWNVQVAMAVK